MQRQFRPLLGFALLLTGLLGSSCVTTTTGGPRGHSVSDSPWVQASPLLKQQIEDEIKRLPYTKRLQRLEQIRWFASVGEPAYDYLLELINDENTEVAMSAMASLGATLDSRLVPYIRNAPWEADTSHPNLALERSRTLLRLGDWSEIPVLVAGLRSDNHYTRALCIDALREVTHEDLDYDARSAIEAREKAVLRWELWWRARSDDSMLSRR